ncbi:MAG: ABC transporter ATP-binding protein/permease [Firmicutes bacterium]|nr:ABC transporter ATP-binding protein/permease [Bacillota bacterium]
MFIKNEDLRLLKRAFTYAAPYRLWLTFSLFCVVLTAVFSLIQPLLWAKVVVNLFDKKFQAVIFYIGLTTLIWALNSLVDFIKNYFFTSINQGIIYDLRKVTYGKVLDMPARAFDEMRVGDFISRIHGDVSIVSGVFTDNIVTIIIDILTVLIVGIIIFYLSVPLAIITLISFPISFFVFSLFGRKIRKNTDALLLTNDSFFSNLQQSVSGIREVKALGIKNVVFNKFCGISENLRKENVKINLINNVALLCNGFVNAIFQTLVMLAGAYFIIRKSLSMESFIAFSSYSVQFSASLFRITKLNTKVQEALSSLTRLFTLIDELDYTGEVFGTKVIKEFKREIEFKEVTFSYEEGREVVSGVSFKIPRGGKTSLVGRSGSGKTTIFNLLLNFYSPQQGEILIDGINIRELEETCLRNLISVVRQEPFLFNASLRENLLYAKPGASEEEIEKALKAAYLDEFVSSLPDGLDTIIDENSVNLSGGQKQRVAIARALLKNSSIILFDEATSSLDNESQYYIRNAINDLAREKTVIIIAHRLFTVMESDRILVLDNGRIIGAGVHSELIQTNPEYQKLYETELQVLTQAPPV